MVYIVDKALSAVKKNKCALSLSVVSCILFSSSKCSPKHTPIRSHRVSNIEVVYLRAGFAEVATNQRHMIGDIVHIEVSVQKY